MRGALLVAEKRYRLANLTMTTKSLRSRFARFWGSLLALVALGVCSAPQHALAQTQVERLLGGLLSTGGYWFTSSSATKALGTPKFYNQTAWYGPSAGLGRLRVAGGFEFIQANDHFFPFTGGNSFALYGGSARLTLPVSVKGLRPYITTGLYIGTLRSDKLGVNKTELVPSLGIGVEWKFAKFLTLAADYRISGSIAGVNTDGFSLSLRIF